MALERYANNFTTTLGADPGATGTNLTLATTAGLVATSAGIATQSRLLIDNEIVIVTDVPTGTTVTVTRGAEGTTAAPHATGATVRQIVTRDALYANSNPGGFRTLVATGTVAYTPSLAVKYHFLEMPSTAIANLTVNAPTVGPVPVEIGDELRIHFATGATARTHTLAWNAVYNVSPTFAAPTAANSGTSISFAYNGTGTATAGAWKRIN